MVRTEYPYPWQAIAAKKVRAAERYEARADRMRREARVIENRYAVEAAAAADDTSDQESATA